MAEEAPPAENPDIPSVPTPAPRRLWERFSLSVLAFILLLLAQASFGMLVRDYSATFQVSAVPLVGYLAFGVLAGFSAGLSVILPPRLALRHPGRGISLALLPILVTALNVAVAVSPELLHGGIGSFTSSYLIGLQGVASVLLGLAGAATTSEV